ncbi:MAG: hypothetical protein ABI772_14895 [Bacteroidota bacterium]
MEIKEFAKELCATENVTTECLVLSQQEYNDLHWENATEFEYKGLSFDVVRIEKKNGSFQIKCYRDTNELRLFSSLKKHLNNHLQADVPQSKNKLKSVTKIVALASGFIKKVFTLSYHTNASARQIIIPANSFYISSPSPPPENFV